MILLNFIMTMSEFGSSFGRLESREKEKRYKFGCVNPTCDWYNVIQEVRMTSDEYNQIRSGKHVSRSYDRSIVFSKS